MRVADVADILRKASSVYDAILLDVDNGPRGLTSEHNHWLYSKDGLATAFRALRPSGILAVWSASNDQDFARRIRRPGFSVEELVVRGRGKRGAHNVIWLAKRIA